MNKRTSTPRNGTTPRPPWPQRVLGRIESGSRTSASIDYTLVMVSTIALAVFGVLMVQSSASVEAIARGQDGFTVALNQAVFAGVGIAAMLAMQFFKPATLRKAAVPAILLAGVALFAVAFTPLGHTVLGNRNWLRVAGIGMQPSEFAKLALAVFSAYMLEKKQSLLHDYKHIMIPVAFPVGVGILGLVLVGRDVGTGLVLIMIIATAMFMAGLRMKLLLGIGAVGLVGVSGMVMLSENRRSRILAWLGIDCGPGDAICYQSSMGIQAFASGGWFGVGPGQSRMKWSYVPEAQNDFIFSILGEEFGFLGVLLVLILFGLLALAMYRIAVRATDLYTRILMACLMAWVIGQSFINLGTVSGLLPVIGVPLPFISSGGSAMLAVTLAMGYVLSAARDQKRAEPKAPLSAPKTAE